MIINRVHKTQIGNSESGFTIIEVLVAISIFSIGFLAVGLMQINAMNRTNAARRSTEAMTLAADQVERLRAMPFYADHDDYDLMPDLVAGTHEVNAEGPFTVRWTVTDDVPIPAYADGVKTTGRTLTRSKTIRIWVTPDGSPDDTRTELMFAKFFRSDKEQD